jgi:SAM-dependent methyltransferase
VGVLGRAADRFQLWNRSRKAAWIVQFMKAHGVSSVLLIGVVPRDNTGWENLVEAAIAGHAKWLVWSGLSTTADASPYVAGNGLQLPFADGAFDLVVSNAVIEHVGGLDEQVVFVAEHRRVGRHWVITTPNRWFPVESHTRVMLRHWSPSWRSQRREFTRLLSRREFTELVGGDVGGAVVGSPVSPTFTGSA